MRADANEVQPNVHAILKKTLKAIFELIAGSIHQYESKT
jgi:hypothetical protein